MWHCPVREHDFRRQNRAPVHGYPLRGEVPHRAKRIVWRRKPFPSKSCGTTRFPDRWLLARLAGATPPGLGGVERALVAFSNAGHLPYMPNRARRTALTALGGPLTSTCAAS